MKMYNNFKCSESNVIFDRLIENSIKALDCDCGANAIKALSAPKYFGNSCGKSPSTSNRKG